MGKKKCNYEYWEENGGQNKHVVLTLLDNTNERII